MFVTAIPHVILIAGGAIFGHDSFCNVCLTKCCLVSQQERIKYIHIQLKICFKLGDDTFFLEVNPRTLYIWPELLKTFAVNFSFAPTSFPPMP